MMDYERTYTLAEIAKKMKRPRTTLQSWKDQFSEFLPSIGRGRNMRYEEDALEVFSIIEKMKEAGEPHERIREVLQSAVPVITIDDVSNDVMPKPIVNTMIEGYESFFKEIQLQNKLLMEQNESFRKQNEERKKEYVELKEQLKNLQETNETSKEQMMQQATRRDELLMKTMTEIMEQKQKQGFWSRLFAPRKENDQEPEHTLK
ncbi:MerR family transcriptional regulator [Halobacillus sp. A5]|uniref:MerR family transcriptional regulator n=1 Tax=Halobacillus sp. A5 TaxID=2880263 RepID=UPI0020A66B37|nr:MerR family transcriptional regulator [Halobacillus sp. A5]MCP3029667.1 MerR family transcriptional regulator [Halobacillus sp. A5]